MAYVKKDRHLGPDDDDDDDVLVTVMQRTIEFYRCYILLWDGELEGILDLAWATASLFNGAVTLAFIERHYRWQS